MKSLITNKDVSRFYGVPLKKHTPKFNGVYPIKEEHRSKGEEEFKKVYARYPRDERELNEFLKWRKGDSGFSKYDRFHTVK